MANVTLFGECNNIDCHVFQGIISECMREASSVLTQLSVLYHFLYLRGSGGFLFIS